MPMHIIINGREIRSTPLKALLAMTALAGASLIAGLVFYVLLPIIGIAVTLTAGLIVLLLVASIVGAGAILLVSLLFGWAFGKSDIRFIQKNNLR